MTKMRSDVEYKLDNSQLFEQKKKKKTLECMYYDAFSILEKF